MIKEEKGRRREEWKTGKWGRESKKVVDLGRRERGEEQVVWSSCPVSAADPITQLHAQGKERRVILSAFPCGVRMQHTASGACECCPSWDVLPSGPECVCVGPKSCCS